MAAGDKGERGRREKLGRRAREDDTASKSPQGQKSSENISALPVGLRSSTAKLELLSQVVTGDLRGAVLTKIFVDASPTHVLFALSSSSVKSELSLFCVKNHLFGFTRLLQRLPRWWNRRLVVSGE
jgi:hypothetical protein